MKWALVLAAAACAVALGGVAAQNSPLCLLVGALVDLLTYLLADQLLCTVLARGGSCPGLRATLSGVRVLLINETVCPLVGN